MNHTTILAREFHNARKQSFNPDRCELPARTIIRFQLKPSAKSDIRAALWLPDEAHWNGRLLGLGNGGAAGGIDESRFVPFLQRGFAVVSTDMGTAPAPYSGVGNPEIWKDFGYRATHLMTTTAKEEIKKHYRKPLLFSYFCGESTGGQQALQEAQRYPEDYDGIVATLPAHCRTPLHAYFLWNWQILRKCSFTKEQEKRIIEAAHRVKAPSELPQFAGKFISDPRCTPEEIEAIVRLSAELDPSLTANQLDGLRKLFEGPRHAVSGKRIFGGLPPGGEFGMASGNLYLFNWVFGREIDYGALEFSRSVDLYTAKLGAYLNADDPDLRAFQKRGGKLMMTSGTADSCVPYHATLDYYEKTVEVFGSLDEVRTFFRFYLIPGMSHGPGPGVNSLPDLLSKVMQWRETGLVPDSLEGKRIENGTVVFTVPIYSYPEKTAYESGRGFYSVPGRRGGIERISSDFLPTRQSE